MTKIFGIAILLGASLGIFGVAQPLAEEQQGPKTTSRKDTSSAPRQIAIAKGVAVTYPENWGPSTIHYNGAYHLVTPPPEGEKGPKTLFAQMIITTESRLDHEEAVRRLSEIGSSGLVPPRLVPMT